MTKQRTFAFVFARGGSKGLPGKNIKPLHGKPLLHYSIDTAMAVSEIEKVFVSTDDPQIAESAILRGATVIERPKELAGDTTPEWLAWRHAIEYVRDQFGDFDCFVSLPATSPLRSVDDVKSALHKMKESDADVCISVTEAARSPYFNMVKSNSDGFVELVNNANTDISRRQDAPVVFDITTVVYVTSPAYVMNKYGLFEGKTVAIEVPKLRAVDIDDIYDFKFAETILNEQGKNSAE